MAGHVVYYYLKSTGKYHLLNTVFRNKLTDDSIILDMTDPAAVVRLMEKLRPAVVINCIGVLIKGSQEHPDNAVFINAYLPHLLEKTASVIGARLIHISTDCVFSGKKGNYTEEDFRDADDVYGRSKALGEVINGRDLTIRTSIIGPELKVNGEGLFHWFMRQTGEIKGFRNAIWGGVTTLELAKVIDEVMCSGLTGLVQLSNGAGISKYDLLCLFKEIWRKKEVGIVPCDAVSINKSIAKSQRLDYSVPEYHVMLKELYDWMNLHKEIYSSIYSWNEKDFGKCDFREQ